MVRIPIIKRPCSIPKRGAIETVKLFAGTLLPSLILVLSCHGQHYYFFTDTQQREIEASIIAYDSSKGKIQLERKKDGKRFWVSPYSFNSRSQSYIQEWIEANQVISNDNLNVSLRKERISTIKEGMDLSDTDNGSFNVLDANAIPKGKKGERMCYEVTLRNRSSKSIENLYIEYRFFNNVDIVDRSEKDLVRESEVETIVVKLIKAGDSYTFKTLPHDVVDSYSVATTRISINNAFAGYDHTYNKISEEELLGFWIKIYGPEIEGIPSVRNICDPNEFHEGRYWSGALLLE